MSILQFASYEGAVKVTDVIKKETRSEVFFLSYLIFLSSLPEYNNECTAYSEGQKSPGAALINGYANRAK